MDIALFQVTQTGDAGGTGVSRFAMKNSAGGAWSNTELNAGAAAILQLYVARKTDFPSNILFTVWPIAQLVDEQTGALVAQQNIPTTGNTYGTGSPPYVAGTGLRLYWHTNQIRNRRMIRGATYMTPLVGGDFTVTGAVGGSVIANFLTAANAYLAAVQAATLLPIVWSRPKTIHSGDGLSGPIISVSARNQAASLRSRRQ